MLRDWYTYILSCVGACLLSKCLGGLNSIFSVIIILITCYICRLIIEKLT